MSNPYIPTNAALNSAGPPQKEWWQFFVDIAGSITQLNTIVNALPGVNVFTVATQPALGAGDAGYLGWVSDYNHFVRWTGAAWQYFGGDDGAYFCERPVAPPDSTGWQLCDGTITKYLTLGATLTETNFTTPDLVSNAVYLKTINAYTGTINAAGGTTGTGTSGSTSPGLTGNTDDESSHTHAFTSGGPSSTVNVASPGAVPVGDAVHTHSGTTGAGSAHHHGVSTITVNGHTHTVPALAVGSIDMANLGVLPYFRR